MLAESQRCAICGELSKRVERLELELETEREAFRRYRADIANRNREARDRYMRALAGR